MTEFSRPLRTAEVAILTGIAEGTLRYWRSQFPPAGPVCYRLGRKVVYDPVDVAAWLEAAKAATARGGAA